MQVPFKSSLKTAELEAVEGNTRYQEAEFSNDFTNSQLVHITAFICGGLVAAILVGAAFFVVLIRYVCEVYA